MRAELRNRASCLLRPWRGPLLPAAVLALAGWLGSPAPGEPGSPLYGIFFVFLAGTIAVAGLRGLIGPATSAPAGGGAGTRTVGPCLRAYAEALAGADVGRAAERLAPALAETLGVAGAVIAPAGRDPDHHSSAGGSSAALAGAAALAEAAAEYDWGYEWLPVAVSGEPLGRLGLRPPAAGTLDDGDRLLAVLLSTPLVLSHACGEERALAARQRREIESLRGRLDAEMRGLCEEVRTVENFPGIVGDSAALRRALALVERVAPGDVSILITGETGTGKELIARAIHALSPRREGPLVAVNCPAIPGALAESELFGHERGSFTDAVASRAGQFEIADGGTIFLDEVADLPLDIQAKLLRVLQEGEVRRVGARQARPVNVRTVAATNRDLLVLARQGRFREDLYYRLAAAEIPLPPLRDRHGDVAVLASFFLRQSAAATGRPVAAFSPEALAQLAAQPWPGNVRQLQNVVQRAVLLCRGDTIRPPELGDLGERAEPTPANFGDAIRREKKRRFLDALERTAWNQSAAARLLGMSRSNFARMLRSLDIAPPRRGERRGGAHQ